MCINYYILKLLRGFYIKYYTIYAFIFAQRIVWIFSFSLQLKLLTCSQNVYGWKGKKPLLQGK